MKKSQRLQRIVELNANEEKSALQALGEAHGKKQDLQKQLEDLQQYQQEYKEKLQSSSENGIKIENLIEFKSFLSKLELVIEKHNKDVLCLDQELDVLRKNWEKQHLKTKNLQNICDNAARKERGIEDKKEQYEQDDHATRMGVANGIRNAK